MKHLGRPPLLAGYSKFTSDIAWTVRQWVKFTKVMDLFREMVRQYVKEIREGREAYKKWWSDYYEHIERIRREPQLRNYGAGPQEPDWEWQEYYRTVRAQDRPPYEEDTAGWTPPHLIEDMTPIEPEPVLPIAEFEFERELRPPLTLAAKFAMLGAIHDSVCDEFEKINPYPNELREGGPYWGLIAYAKNETERGKKVLPVILEEIRLELWNRAILPASREEQNQPATDPVENVSLDDTDIAILNDLLKHSPVRRSIIEVADATRRSNKTVGSRLNRLISHGLACRPEGSRSGAIITDQGRAEAAEHATRN